VVGIDKNIVLYRDGIPVLLVVPLDCSEDFLKGLLNTVDYSTQFFDRLTVKGKSILDLKPVFVLFKTKKSAADFIDTFVNDAEYKKFLIDSLNALENYSAHAVGQFVFFDETAQIETPITRVNILEELTHSLFQAADYPFENQLTALCKNFPYVEARTGGGALTKEVGNICVMTSNKIISHFLVFRYLLTIAPELKEEIEAYIGRRCSMYVDGACESSDKNRDSTVNLFALSNLCAWFTVGISLNLLKDFEPLLSKVSFGAIMREIIDVLKGAKLEEEEEEFRKTWRKLFDTQFEFYLKGAVHGDNG